VLIVHKITVTLTSVLNVTAFSSASEMTYIVSGGASNSTN